MEQYNKHLKKVQERFKDQQKRDNSTKKQKAMELRKQLLQFYAKEASRKLKAERAQVQVGTCYDAAVAKIDHQYLENQSFAMKSEM